MKNKRTLPSVSSVTPSPSRVRQEIESPNSSNVGRRSFLKGLGMAGATLLPASALAMSMSEGTPQQADLMDKGQAHRGDRRGRLTKGDAAILRFLAAAEILETDLWQ